ncbi:myosin heavy chain IB [Orcinus orca]|uniref:myosin heavy chain IB n=1 Tax=Orcinus orca TaxID=9733 RepID=UPI00211172AA|nr:myosin heavy chain IB [Orcinus orca]
MTSDVCFYIDSLTLKPGSYWCGRGSRGGKGGRDPTLGWGEGSWRRLERAESRESPPGSGGAGRLSLTGYSGVSRALGRARASLGAGRRGAGLRESTPPPAPGPPRASRPLAGEPLSRAWPVRVRLLNLGTAGLLGTGLGGSTDLGLGGLGSPSRLRPRGPGSRTPFPNLCPSPILGGARPGAPLFPSLLSLPHSGARWRSRPPASSGRGVAGCGADTGSAATLSKLSGSGPSRPGTQAVAAPADPLLDPRRRPSSRAQTWST